MSESEKKIESFKRKNNVKYYLMIVVPLLLFCKKEGVKTKNDNIQFSKLEIEFPDTLVLDKKYNGFVLYRSLFDTLNLEEGQNRFISLYIEKSKNRKQYSDLYKSNQDTFVMYNDTIRFNVVYNQSGENYLNGYIEDEVNIEEDGRIKIISKISEFHKKIYVKRGL